MFHARPGECGADAHALGIWVAPQAQAASVAGEREAAARFRAALAAKDDVQARLETDLAAARAQAASYEHRCARCCPFSALLLGRLFPVSAFLVDCVEPVLQHAEAWCW